jgi:formiminotetrahydrofolate cyclodeaminase
MVGKIVAKKKANPDLGRSVREFDSLLERALDAVDGDVNAYQEVVAAYGLEKSAPGRAEKIEKALAAAYAFQKEFAALLVKGLALREEVARHAQGSIASDLVLSRHFLEASFRGACQTARINLEYMKDQRTKNEGTAALASLENEFAAIATP